MFMEVLDLAPMIAGEWREKVRLAALAANENPFINMSGIARDVGWSQAALSKFVHGGSGAKEKIEKSERILVQLNLIDPSPDKVMAAELHALADFISSVGPTPTQKVGKFSQFIDFYSAGLEEFAAALKEEKKRGG